MAADGGLCSRLKTLVLACSVPLAFHAATACGSDSDDEIEASGGKGGSAGKGASGGTAPTGGTSGNGATGAMPDGAVGASGDAADASNDAPSGPTVILPKTSIVAAELALLVNEADPQSKLVADYYRQKRGIPDKNVVRLTLPTGPILTEAEFVAAKAEIDSKLGPEIQAFAISFTHPYRVECMSVTSALALGFDRKYCNTSGGACGPTAPVAYYGSSSTAPYTDHGIRPAMMLAAFDVEFAYDLIDRGVSADDTFPQGDGYFVRTTDSARSVRFSLFEQTLPDWDHAGGLTLSYLDNSAGGGQDFIENQRDVLFYLTGLVDVPSIHTNTFRPGAVADHLTSFGGIVPTSSQMSAVRWLELGATASYGTVVEPCNYLTKFPNPRILLASYFRGQTVLEAYFKSVSSPGEGLFVGEPLARPWGKTFVDFAAGTLTIRTTSLEPGKTYELKSATSSGGPFTTVLNDIETADYAQVTITLDNATASFYELVESSG